MKKAICRIATVSYTQADARLKSIYDSMRSPDGNLGNLYQAFSLRPHTIKPADDVFLAAMHHDDNTLPKWFSELIGCYVAILTNCDYAYTHHSHNFRSLLPDHEVADRLLVSLQAEHYENCGEHKQIQALAFVKKLTLTPDSMADADIELLQQVGWQDGEILEITQVVAMFSYFVRLINALGISLTGETIGLYAADQTSGNVS